MHNDSVSPKGFIRTLQPDLGAGIRPGEDSAAQTLTSPGAEPQRSPPEAAALHCHRRLAGDGVADLTLRPGASRGLTLHSLRLNTPSGHRQTKERLSLHSI